MPKFGMKSAWLNKGEKTIKLHEILLFLKENCNITILHNSQVDFAKEFFGLFFDVSTYDNRKLRQNFEKSSNLTPTMKELIFSNFNLDNVFTFFNTNYSEHKLNEFIAFFQLDDQLDDNLDIDFKSLLYSVSSFLYYFFKYETVPPEYSVKSIYKKITEGGIPVLEQTNINNSNFLMEINGACPLCSKNIKIDLNDMYLYSKNVYIYPRNLSTKKQDDFNRISKRPLLFDSYSNIICLCNDCGTKYEDKKDIETFKKLLEIKDKLSKKLDIYNEWYSDNAAKEKLEAMLSFLLYEFGKDEDINNIELRTEGFDVSKKISDPLISMQINNTNCLTYKIIDSFLGDNDEKTIKGSTELGKRLQKLSEKLLEQKMPRSAVIEQIIDLCVKILPSKLKNRYYCEAIVSYFIAHCEVLDYENS